MNYKVIQVDYRKPTDRCHLFNIDAETEHEAESIAIDAEYHSEFISIALNKKEFDRLLAIMIEENNWDK